MKSKRVDLIVLACIALVALSYVFYTRVIIHYEAFDETQVKKVVMGATHTLFVMNDNSLWGVGANDFGQLGLGGSQNFLVRQSANGKKYTSRPIRIMDDVIDAAAGLQYTLVLKSDQTAWVMGNKSEIWHPEHEQNKGQGPGTRKFALPTMLMDGVEQIASGHSHFLMLRTDGTLWGMGKNTEGELGVEPDSISRLLPVRDMVKVADDVEQIFAGAATTFYTTNAGDLFSCGGERYGELGYPGSGVENGINGLTVNYPPKFVMSNVSKVENGVHHTLILDQEGVLWGVGSNRHGQLGLGTQATTEPVQMMDDVVDMAAGTNLTEQWREGYSLALKSDGTLWATGSNQFGQLGIAEPATATPTMVTDNVKAVWAMDQQVIVQKRDNTLTWLGREDYGELAGHGK